MRIDFNLFEEAKPEEVSGGLISAGSKHLLSNDFSLNSVMQMITPDSTVYWVSDGKWSMHEMLVGVINVVGPADVYISSYAMSETPARILTQLKAAGDIKTLHCLLDNRVDVRSAGSHQLMKATCDELVLTRTHAKVTVVKNDAWQLVVVGSANYTENERYEAGAISTNSDVVAFHLKWMQKAFRDGMAKRI